MKKIYKDILILISLLFISVLVTTIAVRPFWDWFAYHYYNGWAFLNHRINIDIMPALFRTYFNPLLDACTYLFVKNLNNHPYLITYISGLKYGIFLFVSYKIFDIVFKSEMKNKTLIVLFCLIMTALSPFLIVLKNFEYTDIQVSILIMIALFILLKTLNYDCYKNKILMLSISGFLVGASFGLKYTGLIYIPATFLIILFKYKSLKHPIKTLLIYGFATALGFLCTDGFWIYIIWNKFHNPVFPYFNEIFKSPYADFVRWLDMDFAHVKPVNIIDFILFPLSKEGFEFKYFDLKCHLTFFCSLILFFFALFFRNSLKKIENSINIDIFYSIIIFTIISFYTNSYIFGTFRYICPLYATCTIIIAITVIYLCKFSYKIYIPILYLLIILQYSTMYIEEFFIPWSYKPKKFIEIPDFKFEDNSIVFCAAYTSSYLIPNQNPKAQYIGFTIPKEVKEGRSGQHDAYSKNSYYTSDYLEKIITEKIKENNNIYFLISQNGIGSEDKILYYEAIKYYSQGKIDWDADYCEVIPLIIAGYNDSIKQEIPVGPYFLYKLKSYEP